MTMTVFHTDLIFKLDFYFRLMYNNGSSTTLEEVPLCCLN